MYDELKLYCKSEGLTEYLRSEIKISSQSKNAFEQKAKDVLRTEKKNPSRLSAPSDCVEIIIIKYILTS